ncbi:glutamine amidotransferase [Aestuariivirga sp.]|uniref:glutamine amidotransferase n=1 Tax=Aestuariivirga sp. TaxID=2650926 RepID=UPI003593DF98
MSKKKVLLVGESWISSATHYKGFDHFNSVTFHLGAEPLVAALKDSPFDLTYMTGHEAPEKFPAAKEALSAYDAVLLSDIGANSILLHPDVWLRSKTFPNRLKLMREWVGQGGSLAMIGGYLSFQGIDGRARWRATAVEEVLPVECLPYDDRVEMPEGAIAEVKLPQHPIVSGIEGPWPFVLGVNEVKPKPDADIIATLPADQGGHPLLVAGTYGNGRTVAWTSDIGPHWLSPEFCAWNGYRRLWLQMLGWMTAGR